MDVNITSPDFVDLEQNAILLKAKENKEVRLSISLLLSINVFFSIVCKWHCGKVVKLLFSVQKSGVQVPLW